MWDPTAIGSYVAATTISCGCAALMACPPHAMLPIATLTMIVAVVGWIAVDMGLRFPGSQYAQISSSVEAHDPMVANGNMTLLLGVVFILELIGGAAVFGAANGSGRAPGK